MKNDKPSLRGASKNSIRHRDRILAGESCGCYFCQSVFSPPEITDWVDLDAEGVGQTALCPRCGIDSVLSSSDYDLSPEVLERLHKHWF